MCGVVCVKCSAETGTGIHLSIALVLVVVGHCLSDPNVARVVVGGHCLSAKRSFIHAPFPVSRAGKLQARLDRLDDAAQCFAKLASLSPSPEAYYQLAVTLEKQGKMREGAFPGPAFHRVWDRRDRAGTDCE